MSEKKFLKNIHDPQKDANETRLAYAQWLEDRKDVRGEFLKLQIKLKTPRLSAAEAGSVWKHSMNTNLDAIAKSPSMQSSFQNPRNGSMMLKSAKSRLNLESPNLEKSNGLGAKMKPRK